MAVKHGIEKHGEAFMTSKIRRAVLYVLLALAIVGAAPVGIVIHRATTGETTPLPRMDGQDQTPGTDEQDADEAEGDAALAGTSYCPDWRWDVKVGSDVDAGLVPLGSTTTTTIAQMGSWTPPSPLPCGHRAAPVETTVYQLDGTLTSYQLELDSDIHMWLRDAAGRTMILEIPNPIRVPSTSPFLPSIITARNQFYAALRQPTSCLQKHLSVPVHARGVGFWDYPHAGGSAPNAIELHPVLDLRFGTPATTPTPISGSTPCPTVTPWPTLTAKSAPRSVTPSSPGASQTPVATPRNRHEP
jgi:hypothetical protein